MAAIDRRRRRRIKAIAAGLGTLAGTTARAGSTLDFKFLHYGESDDRTQVSNPELYFSHDFGEAGTLGLLLSYDSISGASPTGEGPTIDATTSASGTSFGAIPLASYKDTRKAANLSYSRRFGTHLPSVALSYSRESDYLSRGVSLVDSWDFNGGRSTLHYGIGGTSDIIEPVNMTEQFTKKSLSLSAGWSQVLGPRDLLDISASLDNFSGYLNDPYKVVTVGVAPTSIVVSENRPDSRSRKALIFKYGHYFLNRTALKLSYRYYWDDWSIKAHTLEATYDMRLGRRWIVTPRLRYYRQGNADFFAYEFPVEQTYMSADYRLSSFWSWLAGVGVTWEVSDTLSFNVAGNYQDQTGIDRIEPVAAAAPPPGGLRTGGLRLGRAVLEDGGGGDDDGEGGGGGGQSVSPADLRVITVTAGFTIKF